MSSQTASAPKGAHDPLASWATTDAQPQTPPVLRISVKEAFARLRAGEGFAELSQTERDVVSRLERYANHSESFCCFPSYGTLAQQIRRRPSTRGPKPATSTVSRRTIERAISTLIKKGLIVRARVERNGRVLTHFQPSLERVFGSFDEARRRGYEPLQERRHLRAPLPSEATQRRA